MTAIARAYSEIDGDIAEASSVNRVIDDLYTVQNGNIGGDNLANSGVLTSSVADSAVTAQKINNTGVTAPKLNYGAVIAALAFQMD